MATSPVGGNALAATAKRRAALMVRPAAYRGVTLHVDPVQLFGVDTYSKNWPLADKKIPLAKGIFAIGGIPVTYDAEAQVHANAWLGASYGPGRVEDIEVELSSTEEALRDLADDDPIIGVQPLGWFGPTIGVGPSERDLVDKALLRGSHSATATARVTAGAWAGMMAQGQVSAGVSALDIFGVGVSGGLTATASATASASAYAYIRCVYKNGDVTVSNLSLGTDFILLWDFVVSANAGVYVELKVPDIPVISDLLHEVSSWPVIGWFAPDPKKWKWRKDFTKTWDLISEHGQRKWTKGWDVTADGTSPSAGHAMLLEGAEPYDFGTALDKLVGGATPKHDLPATDDGPDAELKDGAKASVVAETRQAAKAQVKSARDNIRRERLWNKRELDHVAARIKTAAASPGPLQAGVAASPSLAIGSGGGTPDQHHKAALEDRDTKLAKADDGAQNLDKKIDEVKSDAESRVEGPVRNEAREGFDKLGKNADNLGQAVGGYGDKAAYFERPVDPAVPATASAVDADKARLEARRVLDETSEQVDEEMIRSNREWHDANAVNGLAAYATNLDSYRADIRNRCETPLKKLNDDYVEVPRSFPTPDEQAQAYRTLIITDARSIAARFTALRAHLPPQPWDTAYAVLGDGKLQLIPGFRSKDKVRSRLYPDGKYRSGTNTWKSNMLTKLGLATIAGKEYWKYTGDRHGMTNLRGDDWWLVDDSREAPSIDHAHESVARHWNRAGHLTDQKRRADYFNGYGSYDANLALLPVTVNSAKGNQDDAIPYEFNVGVQFRGPGSGAADE